MQSYETISCSQYIQQFLAWLLLHQGDVAQLLLELPGDGLDPLHRVGGEVVVVALLLVGGLGLHLEAGVSNGVLLSPGQHILTPAGQSIKLISLLAGEGRHILPGCGHGISQLGDSMWMAYKACPKAELALNFW